MSFQSNRFRGSYRLKKASQESPPLKRGAKGKAVMLIQLTLLDYGFSLPKSIKANGCPDGIFGGELADRLGGFQRDRGIPERELIGKPELIELDRFIAAHPNADSIPSVCTDGGASQPDVVSELDVESNELLEMDNESLMFYLAELYIDELRGLSSFGAWESPQHIIRRMLKKFVARTGYDDYVRQEEVYKAAELNMPASRTNAYRELVDMRVPLCRGAGSPTEIYNRFKIETRQLQRKIDDGIKEILNRYSFVGSLSRPRGHYWDVVHWWENEERNHNSLMSCWPKRSGGLIEWIAGPRPVVFVPQEV